MSKIKLSHLKFWENTALSALLMEVAGICLYAWAMNSVTALAILFLLALAATGGGEIVGFLFGVPRLKTTRIRTARFFTEHLEQVWDWLTKIIIGATLVQLDDIASAIGRMSAYIGGQIGHDGGATAASSVMVFSFVGGFMWAISGSASTEGRVRQDERSAQAGSPSKTARTGSGSSSPSLRMGGLRSHGEPARRAAADTLVIFAVHAARDLQLARVRGGGDEERDEPEHERPPGDGRKYGVNAGAGEQGGS